MKTWTFDQKVSIYWAASALTNQPPDWSLRWNSTDHAMGTHRVITSVQEITTRYYPTAICKIGHTGLLVAGVTPIGKTIIEKWTLIWPDPMPAPVTDAQTGLSSVLVVNPNVAVVSPMYHDDVAGRRFVRNMCALRKGDGTVAAFIVHFDDSNDVYVMGGSPLQLTLLASPTDSAASLGIVAGLTGRDQSALKFSEHVEHGFVYRLYRSIQGRVPAPGGPTSPPRLVVFVDSDKNGSIDAVLQLNEPELAAQGWNDVANFPNWWLN